MMKPKTPGILKMEMKKKKMDQKDSPESFSKEGLQNLRPIQYKNEEHRGWKFVVQTFFCSLTP